MSDDEDTTWYYNGARATVPLFRSKLPDSLKADDNGTRYSTLVRFGTVSNSKGQTIVHNHAHAYLLRNGMLTEGTWSKPFPISGPDSTQCAAAIAHAEAARLSLIAAITAAATASRRGTGSQRGCCRGCCRGN